MAIELLQHFRMLQAFDAKVQTHGRSFVNRNGWIVSARVDVLESQSLALAVLEEVNFTPSVGFQILQSVTELVTVFIVQVALELDQRSVLESVRNVPRTFLFRQDNEKPECVAFPVASTVVSPMRLMKLCPLTRSPRVAELVVAERRLKICVFLSPADSRCRSFWHVFNCGLKVPSAASHNWNESSELTIGSWLSMLSKYSECNEPCNILSLQLSTVDLQTLSSAEHDREGQLEPRSV